MMIATDRPEALWFPLTIVQVVLRGSPSAVDCSPRVMKPLSTRAAPRSWILTFCRSLLSAILVRALGSQGASRRPRVARLTYAWGNSGPNINCVLAARRRNLCNSTLVPRGLKARQRHDFLLKTAENTALSNRLTLIPRAAWRARSRLLSGIELTNTLVTLVFRGPVGRAPFRRGTEIDKKHNLLTSPGLDSNNGGGSRWLNQRTWLSLSAGARRNLQGLWNNVSNWFRENSECSKLIPRDRASISLSSKRRASRPASPN
jgi:hypothetical protein